MIDINNNKIYVDGGTVAKRLWYTSKIFWILWYK